MERELTNFNMQIANNTIRITNPLMLNLIYQFSYYLLTVQNQDLIQELNKVINESKIIIISKCNLLNIQYFIFCFDKTLLIAQENDISLMNSFLNNHKDSKIYILSQNKNEIIIPIMNTQSTNANDSFIIIYEDEIFKTEIDSFSENFLIKNEDLISFWKLIVENISGYLIKKSYLNSYIDRIRNCDYYFNCENEEINLNRNDFIILRTLHVGYSSSVKLIYYIKEEVLFAIKLMQNPNEKSKLLNREYSNYLNVHHPFLLKCFGQAKIEGFDCLILEFIEGNSLSKIDKMNLKINEKLKILFELMIIIQYLHNNLYIYRDLKPNNLILDQNNVLVLIDLDRMCLFKSQNNYDNDDNATQIFTNYTSPEIEEGKAFSFNADIYSIGKIMQLIFKKEFQEAKENPDGVNSKYFSLLEKVSRDCLIKEPSKRPSTYALIDAYYQYFYSKINKKNVSEIDIIKSIEYIHSLRYTIYWFYIVEIENDFISKRMAEIYEDGILLPENMQKAIEYYSIPALLGDEISQVKLGYYYYSGKYVKANINTAVMYFLMAAHQNNSDAQFYLGEIYYLGKYTKPNIKLAIRYFNLAAEQNHLDAYYNLGLIYLKGENVDVDINKSMKYFFYAANQNHIKSICTLGYLYYEGKYIDRDIKKSIFYLQLASNFNDPFAHFQLGLIYYSGLYIERDIDKSIHYFSLAAKQNNSDACYILSNIYEKGIYVTQDIVKSIHYLQIAANLNNADAQYIFASYFYYGIYVRKDINKALYYYTLSANNNNPDSQCILGTFYYQGLYVERDIKKSIHYFTLASKQNNPEAFFNLGLIYDEGYFIPRDINKSIEYYEIASNLNDKNSQFNLGTIYYRGEFVKRDINKAIYYYSLAANNDSIEALLNLGNIFLTLMRDINKAISYYSLAAKKGNYCAHYNLGVIYHTGKYGVHRDIEKAINYYRFAALNNYADAQFGLGNIYFVDKNFRDIDKAFYYCSLAANQNQKDAQFFLGVYYHKGEFTKKDISKAIHYYKELSSFNNQYAKNNLGVIYKNGDGVNKNIYTSIVYFNEAIHQKSDVVSMFNLAKIYFYGDAVECNFEKSISLLIKSFNKFTHSVALLSLLLIKKIRSISIQTINNELKTYEKNCSEMSLQLYHFIKAYQLENPILYEESYDLYRKNDFLYDYFKKYQSSDFFWNYKINIQSYEKQRQRMNLTKEFYEGFTP